MKKKVIKKIRKMLGLGPSKEELVKKQKAEQRERIIQSVMKKTGWERSVAFANMKEARESVGIEYKEYDIYNFYKYDKATWAEEYERIKNDQIEINKQKKISKNLLISQVMEATGWNEEVTIARIQEAKDRTGCQMREYVKYKFYEKTNEQQESLFLVSDSKPLAELYRPNEELVEVLCNKELSNIRFSQYLKREWCVNTKISAEDFHSKFAESDKVIYKPLDGNKGFGIKSYDLHIRDIDEVYNELVELPDGVVEEYVKQHPDMNKLTDASVNTVRVVTLSSKSKAVTSDGKHFDIAYAAIRIGGGKSVVDNFSSGGMVASIDIETGIVCTDGADMDRHRYVEHPTSGTTIKGFKVPFFNETLLMIEDAIKTCDVEGYIGWDVAITETGPALIEVNLHPGVSLLNAPYSLDNIDTKHIMQKYLWHKK